MSEEKGVALNEDQALRLILAAIEAGAIRFPFSGGLNVNSLLSKYREKVRNKPEGVPFEEFVRSAHVAEVAHEVTGLARFDALYILTLYKTLTVGLTKKEADRIQTAILN